MKCKMKLFERTVENCEVPVAKADLMELPHYIPRSNIGYYQQQTPPPMSQQMMHSNLQQQHNPMMSQIQYRSSHQPMFMRGSNNFVPANVPMQPQVYQHSYSASVQNTFHQPMAQLPAYHQSMMPNQPVPQTPVNEVVPEVLASKDPITKAKALVGAVKRALEHLIEVAMGNLKYNASVCAGCPNSVPAMPPPAFESALEEFVLLTNRLEMHLKIILETWKTASVSQRFVPLPVSLSKMDSIQPDNGVLSYSQYLAIVRGQVEFISGLRSALTTFTPL
ncbi:unnamed protein product [Notodromas monacha]|uniref:Mediator of RNA polymerase II transcription subunit 29 n=1 Tax=Notodromas monacha TaxID=399045 RepID=A0A7R9G9P4_9CRUS|nr:unnamed protein product [Notodromas monacha]CAG0914482.1 unnamed protein product [Notodromas monacha]